MGGRSAAGGARLLLDEHADVLTAVAPERHRVHDLAHEVDAEAALPALARVAREVDAGHRLLIITDLD